MEFRDGSRGEIGFTDSFERVHAPFSVGGATVPAGDYTFRQGSLSYTASGARTLSGRLNLGGGGYFGGNRVSVGGNLLARLGSRIILDLTAEHNRIDLPGQEAVDAAVYGTRLDGFLLHPPHHQCSRSVR